MRSIRPLLAAGAAALALALAPAARAADDPVSQVQGLDSALVAMMKDSGSVKGRYAKIKPAVERAFDMPAMTRFAVGAPWSSYSDADKAAVIAAFTRLSAASYASNFDSFTGQSFTVDPKVDERGPDRLVHTKLIVAHHAPVDIVYRMRESGGSWKIIDIFYQGSISQLTTKRSDFAASAATGAQALVAHLNALSDKMLK
jgi:phospholipid transport system substrate-binding protein